MQTPDMIAIVFLRVSIWCLVPLSKNMVVAICINAPATIGINATTMSDIKW